MDDNVDRDPLRWVRRGIVAAVVVAGWVFIAWQNRFHISAPVVFVCLGFLAVVATVYNLWRTGAAAVATTDGEDDSTWAKPAGEASELEREKRTLLKAIKEAEFDLQMGKLSQRDADDMIAVYKSRVYEVYRELDRLEHGEGSAREQILREVKARLEVEARSKKGKTAKPVKAAAANGAASKPTNGATKADPADAPVASETANEAEAAADAEAQAEATANGLAHAAKEAAAEEAATRAAHDDALDADSTTAIEPKRDAAKEATP